MDEKTLLYLPDEVLLEQIFPKLPNDILVKICESHSKFNTICKTDYLWQLKVQNEYPNAGKKPYFYSWRDYYIYLLRGYIPITYQNITIGYIPLTKEDTIHNIKEKVRPFVQPPKEVKLKLKPLGETSIKGLFSSILVTDVPSYVLKAIENPYQYSLEDWKVIARTVAGNDQGNIIELIDRTKKYLIL